jgi:hypothetical protein
MAGGRCERCGREAVGWDLFDYCRVCSRNLCPACMAAGCCGNVPAESGAEVDLEEDEE